MSLSTEYYLSITIGTVISHFKPYFHAFLVEHMITLRHYHNLFIFLYSFKLHVHTLNSTMQIEHILGMEYCLWKCSGKWL